MSIVPPDCIAATPCRGFPLALTTVLLLSGALGACVTTVAPTVTLPAIAVPQAWSGTLQDTSSLEEWWWQFDDPLLGNLVTRALEANTSVNGAEAAVLQARAARDIAVAGLWPALDASASAQHGTSGGHSTGNRFQAGVDASWAPDVFGARRNAVAAGNASIPASIASLGDVRVTVAAEVGLAYILLRSAQARLAIAGDNLASQQETLQLTQWREQAGLVTALETEQARAAVEQTQAQLPSLQTSIEQTRHALAVLTGEPPAALATLLSATAAVPKARDTLAVTIPAETLRQRPDVRAAEFQAAAALARVGQARAERWPSFSLGGSVGLSALTLGSLTRSAAVVTALLAGVQWPVFDGGASRAQVRLQQAALAQAQQAWRATVLFALQDVEDALVALRGDRLRLASLLNAADAAAKAALLARQRYSSGLVDFQTVLQTQRTQFGAQDSVASASAEVSSDHVRLFKVLGGGWRAQDISAASTP